MLRSIYLSTEQSSNLLARAQESLPDEVVALLFGVISDNIVFTKRIEYLKNESQSTRTSFLINPEVQYSLLMQADERGEEMVGIFHSHPAPPRPSTSDIKNMQLNPVVWIVASKTSGNWIMKAYVLEKESPVEIQIQDESQTNASAT